MTNKPYRLPDPKTQPDAFLVILYKTLKRVDYNDRPWDKIYFARGMKRAQELLSVFDQNVSIAAKCMQDLAKKFRDIPCDFTIETIIAHSFDWRSEFQKKTDSECINQLVSAYKQELPPGPHKAETATLLTSLQEHTVIVNDMSQVRLPSPPKEKELTEEDNEAALQSIADFKNKNHRKVSA